jgi:prepilin-type N-terminal cleavage/methylation domain-containing protein
MFRHDDRAILPPLVPTASSSLAARGFTLVELLIVTAIIVLLVALLVPALDRAVYHADLSRCAAQQRAVAMRCVDYAMDHRRTFPYRRGPLEDSDRLWKANNLSMEVADYDLRPGIRGYIDPNVLLNDPLNPARVDLVQTHPDSRVEAGYNLWFGWGFLSPPGERAVMNRLGSRFTWKGIHYDVLVSDVNGDRKPGAEGAAHGHPDDLSVMRPVVLQDQTANGQEPALPRAVTGTAQWVISRWETGARRGQADMNIARQDLSVTRYSGLTTGDERMKPVNAFSRGVPADADPKQYLSP